MTARRKYKSTGPLVDSGTAKTKRDPPCPSARCRCGHVRRDHEGQFGCFDSNCPCRVFVLAKPKKPPLALKQGPYPVPPRRPAPALPAKVDSLLDLTPQQVQSVRTSDGFREAPSDEASWLDVPCRFSGNGREGCFVAPVNRHGGPCVPCWARARRRMQEQAGYYAELKAAHMEIAKLKGGS